MQPNSLVIIMMLILLTHNCIAQETERTRIYETRSNIAAYPCDVLGTLIYADQRYNIPPYRGRFAVVRMVNDAQGNPNAIVRFLRWKVPVEKAKKDTINKSSSSSGSTISKTEQLRKEFNDPIILSKDDINLNPDLASSFSVIQGQTGKDTEISLNPYFLISKRDLDSNCVKVFNTGVYNTVFTLGVVTMPMKIRLGRNFDFQGNLSLGTTAGIKTRISQYSPNYINVLAGLSLATVSLDSFSTSGKISGQPLTNIAVFSPSVGIVFDFGRAQVGAFTGLDLLNRPTQEKYAWIYDKKPWLSIGFGFSIFSVDSKTDKTSTSKQLEVGKASP